MDLVLLQWADIIHTISASTQLRVDAAATDATRIGSTYSVQASNITAGTMGGLGQANETTGVAATHSDGVYTRQIAGDAFSLTESFTSLVTKRMRLDLVLMLLLIHTLLK